MKILRCLFSADVRYFFRERREIFVEAPNETPPPPNAGSETPPVDPNNPDSKANEERGKASETATRMGRQLDTAVGAIADLNNRVLGDQRAGETEPSDEEREESIDEGLSALQEGLDSINSEQISVPGELSGLTVDQKFDYVKRKNPSLSDEVLQQATDRVAKLDAHRNQLVQKLNGVIEDEQVQKIDAAIQTAIDKYIAALAEKNDPRNPRKGEFSKAEKDKIKQDAETELGNPSGKDQQDNEKAARVMMKHGVAVDIERDSEGKAIKFVVTVPVDTTDRFLNKLVGLISYIAAITERFKKIGKNNETSGKSKEKSKEKPEPDLDTEIKEKGYDRVKEETETNIKKIKEELGEETPPSGLRKEKKDLEQKQSDLQVQRQQALRDGKSPEDVKKIDDDISKVEKDLKACEEKIEKAEAELKKYQEKLTETEMRAVPEAEKQALKSRVAEVKGTLGHLIENDGKMGYTLDPALRTSIEEIMKKVDGASIDTHASLDEINKDLVSAEQKIDKEAYRARGIIVKGLGEQELSGRGYSKDSTGNFDVDIHSDGVFWETDEDFYARFNQQTNQWEYLEDMDATQQWRTPENDPLSRGDTALTIIRNLHKINRTI